MTPAKHQPMTKERWEERLMVAKMYDHLRENQQEIRLLQAIGKARGWVGMTPTDSRWINYRLTLSSILLSNRAGLTNHEGRVVLTFDDVLNRAIANKTRLESAYRWVMSGRTNAAMSDIQQAMKCAAIELVEDYKDSLDIEGRAEHRGAA